MRMKTHAYRTQRTFAQTNCSKRKSVFDVFTTLNFSFQAQPKAIPEGHHRTGERPNRTSWAALLNRDKKSRGKEKPKSFESGAGGTFRTWTKNFRSEVARVSDRLSQAMPSISKIEQSKNLSKVGPSGSITGIATGDFIGFEDSQRFDGNESSAKKKNHTNCRCS